MADIAEVEGVERVGRYGSGHVEHRRSCQCESVGLGLLYGFWLAAVRVVGVVLHGDSSMILSSMDLVSGCR